MKTSNLKKERKKVNIFSYFAKKISEGVGSAYAFLIAIIFILAWLISGPFFHYSNTWQLIINTSTTIITFLIVFLIQHTQNRDTTIINLKLDELIKGHEHADNSRIDLTKFSDKELKQLEKMYYSFCQKNNNESEEKNEE